MDECVFVQWQCGARRSTGWCCCFVNVLADVGIDVGDNLQGRRSMKPSDGGLYDNGTAGRGKAYEIVLLMWLCH